jgi:hypothetical protein
LKDAWKLALVASGQADPALLDSYEDERIPIARRLLDTTDRAFRLVVSDNPLAGVFRTEILARIAAFALSRESIQRFAFRTVSQTGLEYREGPLSESLESLPDGAPHAGDRFPWLYLKFVPGGPVEDSFQRFDDMHLNLIVIGQPAPGALPVGDLLRMHEIPADQDNERELARARIPHPSFYLLRPDGHVGLCGARLEVPTVQRYIADRLGIAPVRRA